MKDITSSDMHTAYDSAAIIARSKGKLRALIIALILYSLLFTAAILAIIFHSRILPVFICSILLACTSAARLWKLAQVIHTSDYTAISGRIAKVHKEIKTVRTTLGGGINLFGPRKYDTYNKEDLRLEIFIEDKNGNVRGYYLRWATKEHEKYYESGGEATHIWGTRFPVKANSNCEKWLCPICGEFNSPHEKICAGCGVKAIK